jgi:serine/threonine-protein kinase
MIQQGEVLAGKYRVEQVLGAGGMGYVVAAVHEQLGQRVAVKLLVPELCENEDSVTRFLREARAAVRIQSEHVARVIDVGELTNGAPYMVMEFLNASRSRRPSTTCCKRPRRWPRRTPSESFTATSSRPTCF